MHTRVGVLTWCEADLGNTMTDMTMVRMTPYTIPEMRVTATTNASAPAPSVSQAACIVAGLPCICRRLTECMSMILCEAVLKLGADRSRRRWQGGT